MHGYLLIYRGLWACPCLCCRGMVENAAQLNPHAVRKSAVQANKPNEDDE